MKTRPWSRFLLAALLVPALVGASALEAAHSTVFRTISGLYTPGGTLTVTLDIAAAPGTLGLIVTETIPAAWSISSPNPAYSKETHPVYKWLYVEAPASPFTITYTLHVPGDASGVLALDGSILTSGDGLVTTAGDSILTDGSSTTVPVALSAGWNLVSLPVQGVSLDAQGLLDLVLSQGGSPLEVARWANGAWNGHPDGSPINNFAIEAGKGYFLKCGTPSTLTFTGPLLLTSSSALSAGWNLIGLPAGSWPAQAVIDRVKGQGGSAEEVDSWEAAAWSQYLDDQGTGNFAAVSGRGYFIRCSGGSSVTF